MNDTPPITQREPVALGALVTMGMNAVLLLLTVFAVIELTGEQTAALFGGANFFVVAVVAIKTRSIVWAPATVEKVDPAAMNAHKKS